MIKLLGINVGLTHTTAQHELGAEVEDVGGGNLGVVTINDGFGGTITKRSLPGNKYRYVKAGAAIAAGDAVMVDNSGTDSEKPGTVIPTAAVTDIVEGVAQVAIASGSYGWIVIKGRVYSAKVTDAGNAEGAALGASGTAGTLVAITAATPTAAETIAAIRYAAGRRAMALVDVGTNLWDIELRG